MVNLPALLRLGLGHELDHAGQRGLRRRPRHDDVERAGPVERAGKHAVLRLDVRGVRQRGVGVVGGPLVDGHTLARHGRLVHGARPLDDHAVGRDPLVGTDDDGVTDAEVLDGHLGLGAVTADAGRRRGQLRQRLDGPACAAHRVAFERVADGEQEEQERALEPLAERGGAGRGHEHQEVDLEAPGPDGVDRLADGEPASEYPLTKTPSGPSPRRR